MKQAGFVVPKFGLETLGLKNLGNVHWNLPVRRSLRGGGAPRRGPGRRTAARWWCAPACTPAARPTTSSSSRMPRPRAASAGARPTSRSRPSAIARSATRMLAYCPAPRAVRARLLGRRRSRSTAWRARASPRRAWHNLFARNMFLRAAPRGARRLQAGLHHPASCRASRPIPSSDGTASGLRHPGATSPSALVLIGGTCYAGEIKKSVFTILNYLLPDKNVLPMHCSANIGPQGRHGDLLRPVRHRQDDAVGRSARARCIGDDEHGWGETTASSISRAAATPR